jgi:hypothetical protein
MPAADGQGVVDCPYTPALHCPKAQDKLLRFVSSHLRFTQNEREKRHGRQPDVMILRGYAAEMFMRLCA